MAVQSDAKQQLDGKKVLVWFRRDLRAVDHAALSAALQSAQSVWCAFVFDKDILDPLLKRGLHADRRIEFIHHAVVELDADLKHHDGALLVRFERAETAIVQLASDLGADVVAANHDYEPEAIARDQRVADALGARGIGFYTCKDQVIFERDQLRTQTGNFYSVFTPYKRAWLKALSAGDHAERVTFNAHAAPLAAIPRHLAHAIPSLGELGFRRTNLSELKLPLGATGAQRLLGAFEKRIASYRVRRDFPAAVGPSYLSVHLRFGTLSVRAMVRLALQHLKQLRPDDQGGAATWLSELIWRDFYMQVLYHRPDLPQHAFRREFDQLDWVGGKQGAALFAAWCEGRTGYPLVDAAMRQINQTGYMHNRLRMVTAYFLAKDLGVDWRLGEQYFADQLNDFDLASNNGGWQWSASTGCDAQPYFRIFNPVSQSEKFDAEGHFIRRWVPELALLNAADIHAPWRLSEEAQARYGIRIGEHYPLPIADHDEGRRATLLRYQQAKNRAAERPGAHP
jgi:deoxyribodipyrimidine photo-lyase